MAILTGFPPSNTISTGTRFPVCALCERVLEWVDVVPCKRGKNVCHGCITKIKCIAKFIMEKNNVE